MFNVENNRKGLDFLLGVASGLCRKHKIQREHVFFGGEDCGSYAFNFIHALVSSFLKHVLMSAAVSCFQYGHPEMLADLRTDKAIGRDARTRPAQKVLRVSLHIIDQQNIYLPPSLHQGGTRDQVRSH